MEVLIGLILFFPFLGFIINGVNLKNQNYKTSGIFATVMVFLPLCMSYKLFHTVFVMDKSVTLDLFNWILINDFEIKASFVVDHISSLMLLVITGVGFLIHLFSIEYMKKDAKPNKYFAYLNLFVFSMLILVLSSNLLTMFVGWEGVGLASYLLIGFWYDDEQKAKAGMKAFVMNRIGDAFFLLGIFLIFINIQTLEFEAINQAASGANWSTWAAILLFIGATGKSAQIPLYTWLPDAMAGPTPVSALIHAATMVTAGVYLIIRLSTLYVAAPIAMNLISTIGALTLILAASIALLQVDIKKILAYSTISQLGYMFLAVGVGAFGAGFFHLITHAFFKALLFLGAGSVIHGMHGKQDITNMGGLRKYMPFTYITFLIGFFAIIGLPFFAGFFSKDEILLMSLYSPRGSTFLWVLGIVGVCLTTFYMTKIMCLVFWGKPQFDTNKKPHKPGLCIRVPLLILAILSTIGGLIGIPHVLGHFVHVPNFLSEWLKGSVALIPNMVMPDADAEFFAMSVSVCVVLLSLASAYFIYCIKPKTSEFLKNKFPNIKNVLLNKYYVDSFYDKTVVNFLVKASQNLFRKIDSGLIDKFSYQLSNFINSTASSLRNLHNGNLQQYVLYLVLGLAFISFILMSKFKGT